MSESSAPDSMIAMVDFVCIDKECHSPITFNLMELRESKGRISCGECRRPYHFAPKFVGKLERLRQLILAVRECEDILGDASIAVTTPGGEVRIPYRLLLTRLNTIVSLDMGGEPVDFNFRVEPLKAENEAFR